jgi:hypothetical protein
MKQQFIVVYEKPNGQYVVTIRAVKADDNLNVALHLSNGIDENCGGKIVCAYRVTGQERNNAELIKICDRFAAGEGKDTLPIDEFMHDPDKFDKFRKRPGQKRIHMR